MKNPIHRSLLTAAIALVSMLLAPSVQAQTLNDLYPELATVLAADGAVSDEFGYSISLSGDTLAVGGWGWLAAAARRGARRRR